MFGSIHHSESATLPTSKSTVQDKLLTRIYDTATKIYSIPFVTFTYLHKLFLFLMIGNKIVYILNILLESIKMFYTFLHNVLKVLFHRVRTCMIFNLLKYFIFCFISKFRCKKTLRLGFFQSSHKMKAGERMIFHLKLMVTMDCGNILFVSTGILIIIIYLQYSLQR